MATGGCLVSNLPHPWVNQTKQHTNVKRITYVYKVHCKSAVGPDTFGLPYYCTLFVCILNGLGGLAVWRLQLTRKQTNKLLYLLFTETV